MYFGYPDLETFRIAAIKEAQKKLNGEAVCLDNLKSYAEYMTFEDCVNSLVMDSEYWGGDF